MTSWSSSSDEESESVLVLVLLKDNDVYCGVEEESGEFDDEDIPKAEICLTRFSCAWEVEAEEEEEDILSFFMLLWICLCGKGLCTQWCLIFFEFVFLNLSGN